MGKFVIIGEWRDEEYAALQQAVTKRPMTFEEWKRLQAGPRRHPFGAEAVEVARDGQWVVYESQEAVE